MRSARDFFSAPRCTDALLIFTLFILASFLRSTIQLDYESFICLLLHCINIVAD